MNACSGCSTRTTTSGSTRRNSGRSRSCSGLPGGEIGTAARGETRGHAPVTPWLSRVLSRTPLRSRRGTPLALAWLAQADCLRGAHGVRGLLDGNGGAQALGRVGAARAARGCAVRDRRGRMRLRHLLGSGAPLPGGVLALLV